MGMLSLWIDQIKTGHKNVRSTGDQRFINLEISKNLCVLYKHVLTPREKL
jgi:hypothetical protein